MTGPLGADSPRARDRAIVFAEAGAGVRRPQSGRARSSSEAGAYGVRRTVCAPTRAWTHPPTERRLGANMRDRPPAVPSVFLTGVPLASAVVLLFTRRATADFYPIVREQLSAWMTVHVATFFFVPLHRGRRLPVPRGVEGVRRRSSRVALASFVRFMAASGGPDPSRRGVLVDEVNGLTAQEQGAGRLLERRRRGWSGV